MARPLRRYCHVPPRPPTAPARPSSACPVYALAGDCRVLRRDSRVVWLSALFQGTPGDARVLPRDPTVLTRDSRVLTPRPVFSSQLRTLVTVRRVPRPTRPAHSTSPKQPTARLQYSAWVSSGDGHWHYGGPGADVGGVSPVPAQMWVGRAQSRCRCGWDEPSRCGGWDTFFDNFPRMVMGSSTFSNADIVAIKWNV